MPKETRCNTHELWIRVTQMPDMYALHECLHSSDFLPRTHTLSLPHTLILSHSLSNKQKHTHTQSLSNPHTTYIAPMPRPSTTSSSLPLLKQNFATNSRISSIVSPCPNPTPSTLNPKLRVQGLGNTKP